MLITLIFRALESYWPRVLWLFSHENTVSRCAGRRLDLGVGRIVNGSKSLSKPCSLIRSPSLQPPASQLASVEKVSNYKECLWKRGAISASWQRRQ